VKNVFNMLPPPACAMSPNCSGFYKSCSNYRFPILNVPEWKCLINKEHH
jgi:hypothetical protein